MSDVEAEHGSEHSAQEGASEHSAQEGASEHSAQESANVHRAGHAAYQEVAGNGRSEPDRPDAVDDGTEVVDVDVVDAEVVDAESLIDELSVETLVEDLERVTAERDQYLETSRRIQAEFENYRKQVTKRESEARQRANEGLIGEMLPVLDAFDGAVSSGVEDVVPMRTTLLDALAKQGLERIDPDESPFDPNLHEAVMHEEGAGGEDGPVVAEVMRAGYAWKGRVVRPAMVRVRG